MHEVRQTLSLVDVDNCAQCVIRYVHELGQTYRLSSCLTDTVRERFCLEEAQARLGSSERLDSAKILRNLDRGSSQIC